jgi:hypothetical protein
MPLQNFTLPNDPDATILKFFSVPRGCQAIVNIDGSPSAVIIVNPTNGRKPFIYYQEKDVSAEIELSRRDDHEL